MKTSIATVSISGHLPEKLRAIAAAGFDGVEIFENDFLTSDISPAEVGAMVRDNDLIITLFQPFRDFEGLPEPQRSQAFDRAERKFDLMQQLGTDLMLICSNVSPLAVGGIDRAADDLRALGERAAARGLRIGYEALAWGRYVSDHRDAWEIVRRAGHPNVGIILDSFHTLARRIDVNSIRAIPADRIFIVQLADAPMLELEPLYWSRHFRNMPGEGDLPVVEFMRAVAATRYDGVISLEVFNDQFRGGSPGSIAVDGKRSLTNLMDQVARAEPQLGIHVPAIPARTQVRGIAFVEFSANESEASSLVAFLRALGFARVGRHVSKDVELFRQGEIAIVVNTEREGLAHAAWVAHGMSAYAFGLKVENSVATVERARALGADIFSQKVGAGEAAIPAIRGVGGGAIYFLDDSPALANVWNSEFKPVDDRAARNADTGLSAIDHIAQTMNYGEMLTWVLFYTSIFDTRKLPMLDVIDPAGLVRSQVIENADGSLRLTLNGAENARTVAGRFLAETFGSSVQHLAFTTPDIFQTAERLRSGGVALLPISRNYYDDLQARFGLEIDTIERLRALNVLYDRDDRGEFFQLYTTAMGQGFFFEIVERRAGYAGYGAANAPFRIAAQKRSVEARTAMH